MRVLAHLPALAAIATLTFGIGGAEAAPPRVEPLDCGALAASIGPAKVWQTWFRGEQKPLFGPRDTYSAAPCFKTEAACKAWLYWAQSDWSLYSTFQPCRKGLPY